MIQLMIIVSDDERVPVEEDIYEHALLQDYNEGNLLMRN